MKVIKLDKKTYREQIVDNAQNMRITETTVDCQPIAFDACDEMMALI